MSSFASLLDQIYPALDNGQYDTALQLCLKPEVSKFTLGKALLSYTYSCLRNYPKALEIARAVAAAQPAEDSVVSTLGCTFKALRAEKDFSELYENAMKKRGLDESYVIELFTCYCRQNDPKKMQFIAQKLHKSTPDKVHYLFWSIACMMLQDLPPTMLVLAEKMAYKVMYDLNALVQPSAEEMSLYAFILTRQGKFAQAYDSIVQLRSRAAGSPLTDETHFAANPNFVKMQNLQVSIHKLDLLIRQGKFSEVLQEGKSVLVAFPDQWNVHRVMIDSLLASAGSQAAAALSQDKQLVFPMQDLSALLLQVQTSSAAAAGDVPMTEALTNEVLRHQGYLLQLQREHARLRGPHLAEIHLLSSWIARLARSPTGPPQGQGVWKFPDAPSVSVAATASDALVAELGNLIARYATRFHTKQCCFSDIKPYIHALLKLSPSQPAALVGLKAWAVERRRAINLELHVAVQTVVEAKKKASSKYGASEQPTAAPDAAISAAASASAAPGEEDDDGEEEAPAKSAEDGAAAPAPAAGKKKKNKKKKKSAAAAASTGAAGTVVSAAERAALQKGVVEEFTEVLLPLCGYCKYDQIVSFCDTLLQSHGSVASPATPVEVAEEDRSIALRSALYGASREIFGKGVGGEPRNVQPGDELLVQNSALYRRRFVHSRTSSSAAEWAAAAVVWVRGLVRGTVASPYSFAFKLETIEPFRALAMGEAAALSFIEMGPKHIQHDSMAYLILPTLLETGHFLEAGKEMRAVINFHVTGRRDSLDMVGKAFQYGNYTKVVELSRFADHCQRSTQLLLCKAEMPLLEVVQKHAVASSALKYLTEYMEDKLPESLELQEGAQLAAMVDHMDFGLQVRTDQLGEEETAATARLCRKQMTQRLTAAQRTTRMLFNALQRDGDAAMEHFEERQRCLAELPVTACDPAAAYQPFDQSISRGDGAIGAALQEATEKAVRFAIACIATNPVAMVSPPSSSAATGSATAPKPAGFTSCADAASSAVSAVTALYALQVAVQQASPYMESGSGVLVSPQWLRSVVALVRTLGTDLPLLLQTAAAVHAATPASGGKDKVSASSLQEYLDALQALSSPPLAASALLSKYVEFAAQILLDTLEHLHSTTLRTAAGLAPVSLPDFSKAMYALTGAEQPLDGASAAPPLPESAPGEVGVREYEAARLTMQFACSPLVLDQQGSVLGGLEEALAEHTGTEPRDAFAAAKTHGAGLRVSREFSDREQLQRSVALHLMSSHREICTRLTNLIMDRINALRGSLNW